MTDTHISGGVNIHGSTSTQGDVVGRDKIIHNITVVGQLLDYAKIEGLIPRLSDSRKFESVRVAFEKTFGERLESDLAKPVAITGHILGGLLSSWLPASETEPVPFRKILPSIALPLAERLVEQKYWDAFRETGYKYRSSPNVLEDCEVLFLHSLSELWVKHCVVNDSYASKASREGLYGLTFHKKDGFLDSSWAKFVYCSERRVNSRVAPHYNDQGAVVVGVNFANMEREESRVFLTGLVIDIIRMSSTIVNDLAFWHGLINLLTPTTP
jgi:hypothetical protein